MATSKWMWGDVNGIFGHGAAQMNPIYWSSPQSIEATLEQLEGIETQNAQRPVLMSFTDSEYNLLRHRNVADAIEYLTKVLTPPHSPSSLDRAESLGSASTSPGSASTSEAQEERERLQEVHRRRHLKETRRRKESIALMIAKSDQEGGSREDAKKIRDALEQDMLVLKTGWFLGDREQRKAELALLNAFLDEVDAFEKVLDVELQDALVAREFAAIDVVTDSEKFLDRPDSEVETQVGKWNVDVSHIGVRAKDTDNLDRKLETASGPQFADPAETKFTYEQIKGSIGKPRPKEVDPTKKEAYLSDAEFQEIFGMSAPELYKLTKWKQVNLKKAKQLF